MFSNEPHVQPMDMWAMTRPELRRLFLRHRGESARLARKLKLSRITISRWLYGQFDSFRIEAAAYERAKQLVKKEPPKEVIERLRRELRELTRAHTGPERNL